MGEKFPSLDFLAFYCAQKKTKIFISAAEASGKQQLSNRRGQHMTMILPTLFTAQNEISH